MDTPFEMLFLHGQLSVWTSFIIFLQNSADPNRCALQNFGYNLHHSHMGWDFLPDRGIGQSSGSFPSTVYPFKPPVGLKYPFTMLGFLI
jgi:hypothetical protein